MGVSKPPVFWRFVICNLLGVPISIITGLCIDPELTYQLNRPAMLTFEVPSDQALINIQHTDGDPYLSCGNRIIKGYCKVATGASETPGGWELKFVGRVWNLEDQGDGDVVKTMVTCYDPWIDANKRIVRDTDGTFTAKVDFTAINAGTIIKDMIDRTNAFGRSGTMVTTVGATYDAGIPAQTVEYNLAYIGASVQALTDTGAVDIVPVYLDSTDGTHLQIGALAQRGTDKSGEVIFGYDAPPRTASAYDRTQSMEQFANDITIYGNSRAETSADHDNTSITKYGSFESVDAYPDIYTTDLLDDLVAEQVALRKEPQDIVSLTPAPEISAQPFVDFDLGDRVSVNAARQPNPSTRATVNAIQRVYGFVISIDNDYGQYVSSMLMSSQAESSED